MPHGKRMDLTVLSDQKDRSRQEHWDRLCKAAIDNPDLPVFFINEILLASEEANSGQLFEYTHSGNSSGGHRKASF